MQQGDTERGLSIQLASSPPPSRASKIQIVEPSSVPKLNGKGKKEAGGRWTIQVGAFKNRSDAREQLQIVEKRFGRQVDDAKAVAEKDGGRYVARFAGMTEAEAKSACKAIKSKKQPCVVLSPGRG
jgi:D-alanyl-D-alanine carboxypeptidase (penicillin-binding protein 5/6)